MANSIIVKDTNITSGDLIKVHLILKDKEKERTQIYEGRVIAIKGRAPNSTFTVRRIGVDNIGIERIFPINSPLIAKVEIKKAFPVRRAKLYYLRDKK